MTGRQIDSVAWSVVDGQEVELISGEDGSLTVMAPALSQNAQTLLELTVTDSVGEVETAQVVVNLDVDFIEEISHTIEGLPSLPQNYSLVGRFNHAFEDKQLLVLDSSGESNSILVFRLATDQSLEKVGAFDIGQADAMFAADVFGDDMLEVIAYQKNDTSINAQVITELGTDSVVSRPISVSGVSITGQFKMDAIQVIANGNEEIRFGTQTDKNKPYEYACVLTQTQGNELRCDATKIYDSVEQFSGQDALWPDYSLIDLNNDGTVEMVLERFEFAQDTDTSILETELDVLQQTSDFAFSFSSALAPAHSQGYYTDVNNDGLIDFIYSGFNQTVIAQQIPGDTISFDSSFTVPGDICPSSNSFPEFEGHLPGYEGNRFVCADGTILSLARKQSEYRFDVVDTVEGVTHVYSIVDFNGDQIPDLWGENEGQLRVLLSSSDRFAGDIVFPISAINWSGRVFLEDIDSDGDLDVISIDLSSANPTIEVKLNNLISQ